MRRRAGTVATALLFSTLLALGAGSVLLVSATRPCPDCGGADLGRKTFVRKGGYCRTQVAPILCPRCGDGGKVPALQAIRGSDLSPEIAALIRAEKDPYTRGIIGLIDAAVLRDGLDPKSVCGWSSPPTLPQGWARFVKSEGKDFVVAIFYPDSVPNKPRAGAILFDLRGRVLDVLSVECDPEQSYTYIRFPETPEAGGPAATLSVSCLDMNGFARYLTRQGGQASPSITVRNRSTQMRICIAGGRLALR
ncbi:MAG: hypothetical protein HY293_04380 [Planctomycetes bacterium]|nr:hypothetical protein [Planctomycetota bacterium]